MIQRSSSCGAMGETYKVSDTARIQAMENELAGQLAELKQEIEENGILQRAPTQSFSSVCIPKDISYFRKERELLLKKGLQVAEAKPLLIQADVMQRELESCLTQEYTAESLPLLLHQFFTDRMHQLVQCKYLHMLRWKRFCQHTNIIEQIYPLYKKQISRIMKEYDDAVQRARRLSAARECLLTETGNASKFVTQEDVVIYLQWLVCHLHSLTTIHGYLRVLQYLPMSHNVEVTPEKLFDALADDEDKGSTITLLSSLPAPTRPSTAFSSVSGSAGKTSALLSSAGTHPISIFNKYSSVMGFEDGFDFEVSLCLPVHKLNIEEFKPQLQYLLSHFSIEYDVDDIRDTANEMELFTLVIRKFRSIFSKEETMKTFPIYDAFEPGTKHWGMKGPNMALRKEANWIPFLKIKPKQDPWQQKIMTKLKEQKNMDEILRLQSQFFQISDPNQVMDALRQHAVTTHEPYTVQPLAVTSHRMGQHTSYVWNRIYGNAKPYQEPRRKESGSPVEINDWEVEDVNQNKCTAGVFSSKKSRDQGYSYTSTMQLLGLDEGNEENAKDPVMTQGAYLSLLFLRHLRIRELQRICLGILNYFRSIERTLTISICGLTLNGGKLVRTAADTCWISAEKGGLGVADGVGSHYYLHKTPADYKKYLTEFMEFSEIENHDDFYTTEDGFIHTQDQRGIYIIYDVAIKDLTELEKQMLLLATQYIEKERGHLVSSPARGSQCGEIDLPAWAHLSIDRFAVLLDLWRCEMAFLENKRQLLDSYFEAYQHVFDVEERFALGQVITDIMHKRPRFNLSSEYFVKTYQAECACLKLHLQLIRDILNKQIDDQREYVQRIWRDDRGAEMGMEFGLPLNIITKQPIAINNSCPALKKIYLLEFHPSLGLASRVLKTLEHAYWELHHIHRPKSADESISLEKQVLNLALEKWAALEKPESSYSLQVQKDLFSGVFIEDPLFVRDIGFSFMEDSEEVENRPGAEKQAFMLHSFSRLLEIITLRHRLIEAASETALLARLYKSAAAQMGFDEFHLYLRPVQFEFAAYKEKADQPPPVFITTLLEDNSNVDRYVSSSLPLAIKEVDENHIGKFSFRTKEAVLQLMARHGVDNMQVALACQTVQKNSLMAAVQQALFCPKEKAAHSMDSKDAMSSYRSQDNLIGTSHCGTARESESQQIALSLGISRSPGGRKQLPSTRKRPPEAFVSIQLEKLGPRDMMLNQFIRKKSTAGPIMKNPEEVEKIKRQLIVAYCRKYTYLL
ncbi:uncharacterized protein LOC121277708 [Carcharodon carcharias]|uniref:uncharacterized protein LOC121277708 n=1 Tax=Carcharodon carcharias TaxID=13397 RepID=UPI001B7ED721|nr:uncharacterized protein LOC121277708 [Carcharodon carcharias]